MKEIKEQALKIFLRHFPKQKDHIKEFTPIHNGYTNFSYYVVLDNDEKYQVRIPHSGDLISRAIEYEVVKLSGNNNFVYFDVKTGQAIKNWIPGQNPKKRIYRNKEFNKQLFEQIKKLHSLKPIKNLQKIDFVKFNENLSRLDFQYQKKYLCLLDRRRGEPLVVTHSDINPLNIIYTDEGKIKLIDFEWCCLAPEYWDYANWIRESGINYNKFDFSKYIPDFSQEKLCDYIYICSVFSYLWTFAMPQTLKIIKYRKTVLRQIKDAYKDVMVHEKTYYN